VRACGAGLDRVERGGAVGSCSHPSSDRADLREQRVGPHAEREAELVLVEVASELDSQHEIRDPALARDDFLDPSSTVPDR